MRLQHPKWLQMVRGSVAPSRCRLGGLHQLALLRQAEQAAKPDHGLASQALLVIDSSSIHLANPVTSTPVQPQLNKFKCDNTPSIIPRRPCEASLQSVSTDSQLYLNAMVTARFNDRVVK